MQKRPAVALEKAGQTVFFLTLNDSSASFPKCSMSFTKPTSCEFIKFNTGIEGEIKMAKDELDDEWYDDDEEDEEDEDEEDDDEEDEEDEYPEFTGLDLEKLITANMQTLLIEGRIIRDFSSVVSQAEERGISLAVEDCRLYGTRFAGAKIDMSFDDVSFMEPWDSADGHFMGHLHFYDSAFSHPVNFRSAVFEKDVLFDDCSFAKVATFAGSRFKSKASFMYSEFDKGALFDHAVFDEYVDFSRAEFGKRTSFKETVFEKGANIRETDFAKDMAGMGLNKESLSRKQSPHVEDAEPSPPEPENQHSETSRPVKKLEQVKPKREFNPWQELDRVSKKSVSRRDLLRGAFKFIPKKEE
jgi:hypothetical protein